METDVFQDSMVAQALDLWATCRMIEKSWGMCGEDTLGLTPIAEEGNPWKGKIPITPIMDTQLDQIIIQGFLVPLREKLLHELTEKVNVHLPDMWFEIY